MRSQKIDFEGGRSELTVLPARPTWWTSGSHTATRTIRTFRLLDTPHIDRIALEGMRFDRCVVPDSICGPSRAVIQTGKYSHANGFFRNGNRF